MTSRASHVPAPETTSKTSPDWEEIIRQLEQFPVEVLEAALLVLQTRQTKPRN